MKNLALLFTEFFVNCIVFMFFVKPIIIAVISTLLLSSCATPPPKNPENICEIFREHRDWYFAAKEV